jgi:phospholipase/carboxylesterase
VSFVRHVTQIEKELRNTRRPKMKNENICDLDTIVSEGKKEVAVVVLHGYGADNKDFVPFANYVLKGLNPTWYFVNGVLPTTMGGYETGRCWFPIDMVGLNQAMMTGTFEKFFQSKTPEGLPEASEKLIKLIEHLRETHEKIYLGGFSQGSMMCADIAFHRPDLVDKLFLLSSTMLHPQRWEEVAKKSFPFPIFQSHGVMDPVLPVACARQLKSFLENFDHDPKYIEFNGAHEVPLNVVNELDLFLRE